MAQVGIIGHGARAATRGHGAHRRSGRARRRFPSRGCVAERCDPHDGDRYQSSRSLTLGPGGIVEGARAGTVVIDHSTIDPDGARRIASSLKAKQLDMLDAPVSGGAALAEAGALSIMVGGEEDRWSAAVPSWRRMDKRSFTSGQAVPARLPRPATKSVRSSTRWVRPKRC
jgi:NAD binding domain of 6-phosphogluconate dehydrogenase